ncbi:hypothetical protein RND81_02G081500 [Saponaria officinalis]|uniref:Uncharacterized protein n=1 Tax=Saponaria officinalis TaxID=3572 RepID=A0AAW1MS85_SAPOF
MSGKSLLSDCFKVLYIFTINFEFHPLYPQKRRVLFQMILLLIENGKRKKPHCQTVVSRIITFGRVSLNCNDMFFLSISLPCSSQFLFIIINLLPSIFTTIFFSNEKLIHNLP